MVDRAGIIVAMPADEGLYLALSAFWGNGLAAAMYYSSYFLLVLWQGELLRLRKSVLPNGMPAAYVIC
jgi:hypothetical protein